MCHQLQWWVMGLIQVYWILAYVCLFSCSTYILFLAIQCSQWHTFPSSFLISSCGTCNSKDYSCFFFKTIFGYIIFLLGSSFLSYPNDCPPNMPCNQQVWLNLTQSILNSERVQFQAESISGYVFYCIAGAIGLVAAVGWLTMLVQEKIIKV